MEKIRKIGVFSFAKFQAFMGLFIGFVFGILYSFGGLIIDILVSLEWITSTETPGLSYGTILAFGALIGMPIIGAVLGFIFGIIQAILFNFTSNWFGGIFLEIKS
ncbi:hypothetical protein [Winogradskyella vincentii]|uniref:DUF3566 domain-containing protein n=1 Tax=Winogradskyella vincentii TaxID=2877122 RepID=A0ABS7Y078_9FLAO|nr:hypothetical protein [Winogradskyella vincentii]MCA0153324.1 hypothetical protein [Winogradskyella vincentii]